MTKKIVLWGRPNCQPCQNAKDLLKSKNLSFTYKNVWDPENSKPFTDLCDRLGIRHTVPQIFIDGKHIGGWSDLKRLSDTGKL